MKKKKGDAYRSFFLLSQLRERRRAERLARDGSEGGEDGDDFDVDAAPELNAQKSKRELAAEAARDDIVR